MNKTRVTGPRSMHLNDIDWVQVATNLDLYGAAVVGPLLDADQCHHVSSMYCLDDETLFRSRVVANPADLSWCLALRWLLRVKICRGVACRLSQPIERVRTSS